jgi:hypothetical protein
MRRFTLSIVAAIFAAALGTSAFAQAAPNQLNDQQLNLILRQAQMQMRQGNFNAGNILQQLQQQGIVNADQSAQIKQYLDQMQQQMTQQQQARAANTLQGVLNASDEEWAVLSPRIQRVIELATDLGINDTGITLRTAMMGLATQARNDLYLMLSEPTATEDQIAGKLANYRAACQKVRADLSGARMDLVNVLTLRQESILLNMQVIE